MSLPSPAFVHWAVLQLLHALRVHESVSTGIVAHFCCCASLPIFLTFGFSSIIPISVIVLGITVLVRAFGDRITLLQSRSARHLAGKPFIRSVCTPLCEGNEGISVPSVRRHACSHDDLQPWGLDAMATSQPSLQVLTHKHGKSKLDRAQDESILIPELAQRIANGETTNVKGLCAADAWPTSSVPCRALVDRLRGTEGRPWGRYSALLYIGGGGTYTRAHADPFDNYYLQISGVKRWVLFPPSAAPFLAAAVPRGDDGANAAFVSTHPPSTRYATSPPSAEAFPEFWAAARPEALVVDLQPGDLLHVPPCWFHSVENLGDATEPCVGMSMGWLSPRRAFSCSPLLAACFFVFNPAFFSTNGWLYRRVVWPALARYGLAAARVDDDMMQPCRPQKFPAAWAIGREEKAATASVDDEMMQPCRPQKFPLSWLSGGRHEKAA